MKDRAKELNIAGIRVNNAGCLERCELGPNMVIYPEGVWYHFETRDDIDEILERHILGGERVERLILEPGQVFPKPIVRETLTLTVKSITRLTGTISRFELVDPEGGELAAFTAGAHIDVFTNTGRRRSYSLANDPAERHRYVIGVLREDHGAGSQWMHGEVSEGMELTVSPPINNFPLAENAAKHTLIAGGIGITPLLAMGYALRRGDAEFTLHYCAESADEAAFMGDVTEVFGDRVVWHFDGGNPAQGIDLESVLQSPENDEHLYICGPAGLLKAAREKASHWPAGSVHFELFAPTAINQEWHNEAFEISLSRHKKILTVPADKTILQAVRDAGVDVESSCEQGICNTCRTGLLGGKAEHRDEVLSDEEKVGQSVIMICTSRAQKGETLILDL
jgi:vanillate O-demethylase ferredoxin subunit